MGENTKKAFWAKWEESDELEQRKLIEFILDVLVLDPEIPKKELDKINAISLNSYFIDLYEYCEEEHARMCDIKERKELKP